MDWAAGYTGHKRPTYTIIHVPTITLTDLLDRNGIKKLDFLSIDVEGSEPEVLGGFDIDRFKPELVCIETNSNKDKILFFFVEHRYHRIDAYLIYDKENWYFTPNKK